MSTPRKVGRILGPVVAVLVTVAAGFRYGWGTAHFLILAYITVVFVAFEAFVSFMDVMSARQRRRTGERYADEMRPQRGLYPTVPTDPWSQCVRPGCPYREILPDHVHYS